MQYKIIITIILSLIFIISCSNNLNNKSSIQNITNESINESINNTIQKLEKYNFNDITIETPFMNKPIVPVKYTCNSDNINPEIRIKNIPNNIKSLAIVMDDPDAPTKTWKHWILYNINNPNKELIIQENNNKYTYGKNSWNNNKYEGPCPPNGKHRYFLKFYFLNETINLRKGLTKTELINEINNSIIYKREIFNYYIRRVNY